MPECVNDNWAYVSPLNDSVYAIVFLIQSGSILHLTQWRITIYWKYTSLSFQLANFPHFFKYSFNLSLISSLTFSRKRKKIKALPRLASQTYSSDITPKHSFS